MYQWHTKVTPKAGQNGPMWLYVGSGPTILPVWLGISYNYFSMMVVGYMGKLQARFVLQRSPFDAILLVSVTDTNHSTFQGENNGSGRLKV